MHEESGNGAVEVFWDVKHTSPDLLEESGDVLVVERQSAAEKGVEDNTTAPDVHLWASIQPVRRQGRRKMSPPVLLSLVKVLVVPGELGTCCQLHQARAASHPSAAHMDAPN